MTEVFLYKIPKISEDGFYKLLELVSLDRKTKVLRLKNRDKQLQSLLAGALLQAVLCDRLKVDGDSLKFEKNENGKPFLQNYSDIHFNISHTDGLVAVVLSKTDVGIDAERIKPVDLALAERYFTEAEQMYVFADAKLCEERFFEVWTKKEAFAKRLGVSVSKILKDESVFADKTVAPIFDGDFVVSVAYDGGEMKIYDTDYCEKLLTPIATGVGLW